MANYGSYNFKGVVAKPYSIKKLCDLIEGVLGGVGSPWFSFLFAETFEIFL